MRTSQLVLAFLADLAFGDLEWIPHPVQLFGLLTKWEEKNWRKVVCSPWGLRVAGLITAASISVGAVVGTWVLLKAIHKFSPLAASIGTIYLAYTTLSARGLDRAAGEVVAHLRERHLEDARSALAKIVGRDTKSLDEPEVMRGVIETVAENTSDGFIAPLFYLAIAGVPAALTYKAINTLDSMIGYKNERYLHFGWAPARMDDLANYLPARLTAVLVTVAAFVLRLDWRKSLRIVRRDARQQPSPNSGFPEAAYAGALRIRLGGLNFYEGHPSQKAYIGDSGRELTPDLYPEVRRLLYFTSALALAVGIALSATLRSLP